MEYSTGQNKENDVYYYVNNEYSLINHAVSCGIRNILMLDNNNDNNNNKITDTKMVSKKC